MRLIWPEISYAAWQETCSALHLFTQVVGKYRLARTAWVNHSWHATLYPNARGFTTGLVPDGAGGVELSFDFIAHLIRGAATDGRTGSFALGSMSVATFSKRVHELLLAIGATPELHGTPNEIPDAIPFAQDTRVRPYDSDAVNRFFHASIAVARVLQTFRTGYIGKVSPVHLFWGSFDLAVTRFSGLRAPLHPGGVPGLPDEITREAYSHEVSSAGFWPGGGPVNFPAFYSYSYPTPPGFSTAQVAPPEAYYDQAFGEFLLPYDAVRTASDPEATLMSFLESTYRAAARLGQWNVAELECSIGMPRKPRPI